MNYDNSLGVTIPVTCYLWAIGAFGYNSSAAAAREVFKPSTDSTSLVIPSQKNFFSFGFGVLLGERHKWGCFRIFARPWTPIE